MEIGKHEKEKQGILGLGAFLVLVWCFYEL
jgi:hypothetical protein